MSTALETQQQQRGLRAWVETDKARNEIAAAVGDVMPAEQFTAHMLVAFQDEKVRRCSDKSKFRALMECAALGLLPTLDQVQLIPYGDELNAMPQWQGYKAVMERHPSILEVQGFLVHNSDAFQVKNGEPLHDYDPLDDGRTFEKSSDIRGGYLKIIYCDGRPPKYHFVPRKQIEKAQACAKTQKVWNAWYYQMALKTLYRDAYARRAVPIDPLVNARLQRVVDADDLNLGNDPARVGSNAESHIEQARWQHEHPGESYFDAEHSPVDDASQEINSTPAEEVSQESATPPELSDKMLDAWTGVEQAENAEELDRLEKWAKRTTNGLTKAEAATVAGWIAKRRKELEA